MSSSDENIGEKGIGVHHREQIVDLHDGLKHTKSERIHAIDAMATAPGVTRETFAHIDEKKLLRKMDLALLPMLTLLYLLSFIDRGNIVGFHVCQCREPDTNRFQGERQNRRSGRGSQAHT